MGVVMIGRYKKIISIGLDIQQKRKELQSLEYEFSKHITVDEIKSRCFDNEVAGEALKLIDGLKFEKARYVDFKAIYKDLDISVHQNPEISPSEVMSYLIQDVKSSDIIN